MLRSSHSSSTGTKMAAMMMRPPIVGVPAFSFCPASPNSRTLSPICFFFKNLMKYFPKKMAISNASTKAAAERKEIYWKTPAPGYRFACIQEKR